MKVSELFEDKWEEQKQRYKANAKAKRDAAKTLRQNELLSNAKEAFEQIKKLKSYKDLSMIAKDHTSDNDLKKGILYFVGRAGDNQITSDSFEFEISNDWAKFRRYGFATFSKIPDPSLYSPDLGIHGFDRSLQLAYNKLDFEIRARKDFHN